MIAEPEKELDLIQENREILDVSGGKKSKLGHKGHSTGHTYVFLFTFHIFIQGGD